MFNFSPSRCGKGATEAGAFERCGGGGEPQRARYVLTFGDGERELVDHLTGGRSEDVGADDLLALGRDDDDRAIGGALGPGAIGVRQVEGLEQLL